MLWGSFDHYKAFWQILSALCNSHWFWPGPGERHQPPTFLPGALCVLQTPVPSGPPFGNELATGAPPQNVLSGLGLLLVDSACTSSTPIPALSWCGRGRLVVWAGPPRADSDSPGCQGAAGQAQGLLGAQRRWPGEPRGRGISQKQPWVLIHQRAAPPHPRFVSEALLHSSPCSASTPILCRMQGLDWFSSRVRVWQTWPFGC